MKQVPILFLGDAPSVPGGLSRIGRDLAILVSKMEEFRVGFLGRGGVPTQKLPFMQYNYPEFEGWGEKWLQDVWNDFSQGEQGVLFTIWDPSRLWWLNPRFTDYEWIAKGVPFQKWGYFPIDHEGPGGMLSVIEAEGLRAFDRVLAYGMYGSEVISRTLGWKQACDWIPHGINMDTFQPRDTTGTKLGMGVRKDSIVIGIVMTNQLRKDWGLAFEVISQLKAKYGNRLYVWCKTDSISRHWDFRSLAADFHVEDVVHVDLNPLTDKEMSYMYSMCDLTFLPSLGEGFGYPIVESMACGVPCITGSYAGGGELIVNSNHVVPVHAFRWDSAFNAIRPVYAAHDFTQAIEASLVSRTASEDSRMQVDYLNWPNLHTVWERWFREGVQA